MEKNDPFVKGEKSLVVLFSSACAGIAVVRNFDGGVTLEREDFVLVSDPAWGDYNEAVSVVIDPSK